MTTTSQWGKISRRYRLLTAGLLQASAYAPVRSRIVPAATALPKIFAGIVNQLAERPRLTSRQ